MEEVTIPSPLKQFATSIAIALFRTVRALKRGLQHLLFGLGRALAPIGHALVRWFILPVYRAGVSTNIKFQRLALPTRSFALFFVSNRYLFHAVLALATIVTVVMNIQARQALAQDVGQNSLLYALATDSEVEIVRETAREAAPSPHLSYLGSGTLVAVPHIDFDYDETDQEVASLSVPGTISAPEIPDSTTGAPRAPRTRTETYIVKDGDTIGSIAQDFNVNVGTLLWNNNLTERQFIRPGDSLKVPPVSGMLAVVKKGDTIAKLAAKYEGNEDEIKEFNRITDETTIALGTELMIPGGHPPAPEQTLLAIASRSREQQTSLAQRASGAVSNIARPADADTKALPTARLLWPTNGHVITQYYGWKHTGVDIDGDFTSPLYAAYDGVVTTAGWNNGGYGLQVMIKHPNGMMTRYGHSSKLFVKVGDEVKRGQVIAMMGSTGRSTGSHLHFEVYIGGKRTNPLAYIR